MFGQPDGDALLGVQTMLVQGPLGRSVEDVRLGFAAMAAYDPTDPVCVPAPLAGEPLPGPIRVGLVREVGVVGNAPAVDAALSEAADRLTAAGYVVEEIALPLLAHAWRLWWQLVQGVEFLHLLPAIEQYGDAGIRRSAETQFAFVRDTFGEVGFDDYVRGYGRRSTLVRRLQHVLQSMPVVLTPVSAERTFEIEADVQSDERTAEVITAQWPMMSVACLGAPGLTVPVQIDEGLPISVQLIGARFREDTLLDAGAAIERRALVSTPIDPR
jgi:amidase